MQRDDVGCDQPQQHQGHCNHMEAEEAVQGGVAHHVIAANQQRQIRANEGDGCKKIHDHLGAPVRHLAPGQQVTHEGFGHKAQKDRTTEDPDQLARLTV